MTSKMITIFFLLLAGFYLVSGQSATDFSKQFGNPLGQNYSISDKISMKPKFDKNGQVCWLELSGLSALEASLTFKDFKDVVKRIIPTDKRGEKQQPFVVGQWATSKGEMIAILSYEEVGLLYSSAIEVFAFCEEPKMQSFDVSRVSNMLENQIGAYDSLKVDKAYIYWNKRKCQ